MADPTDFALCEMSHSSSHHQELTLAHVISSNILDFFQVRYTQKYERDMVQLVLLRVPD